MSSASLPAAHPFIRTRLSIAYFLTFAIWGSWGFAVSAFADSLGFDPGTFGIAGTWGAMLAPLIGPVADRRFAAQKIDGLLHLLSAASLATAAIVTSNVASVNESYFLVALILHGVFFMPTIGLTNTIVFTHIPDKDKAPRVFMFGTIGWICAVLAADCFLGGAGSNGFLWQAATLSAALGLFMFTLPNTPPKGKTEEGGGIAKALGLDALGLFKKPDFAFFVTCVFLVSVAGCGYFFTVAVPHLQESGYSAALALTTLCQFAEIIFMAALPFFVKKYGLKKVIIIGMVAWGLRYICFSFGMFPLAIVALLLHGFCYSFLYVGAYMYGERKAPAALKTSVQSLLVFLLLGVGQVVGGMYLASPLMKKYAPKADVQFEYTDSVLTTEVIEIDAVVSVVEPDGAVAPVATTAEGTPDAIVIPDASVAIPAIPSPALTSPAAPGEAGPAGEEGEEGKKPEKKEPQKHKPGWAPAPSVWDYLDLNTQMKKMLGDYKETTTYDVSNTLDTNEDGKIDKTDLDAIKAKGFVEFGVKDAKGEWIKDKYFIVSYDEVVRGLKDVALWKAQQKDPKVEDVKVEEAVIVREDWIGAHGRQWNMIFLIPAIAIFIIATIFCIGAKEPPKEEDEA